MVIVGRRLLHPFIRRKLVRDAFQETLVNFIVSADVDQQDFLFARICVLDELKDDATIVFYSTGHVPASSPLNLCVWSIGPNGSLAKRRKT
jgi:hypothetical protein